MLSQPEPHSRVLFSLASSPCYNAALVKVMMLYWPQSGRSVCSYHLWFLLAAADFQGFSELFVKGREVEAWGLVAPKLILSHLLRKALFFLYYIYYTLAGLFSRGGLTLKLVDFAELYNTDLHEKMQNVPILSGYFKERLAIKEQEDQEGLWLSWKQLLLI